MFGAVTGLRQPLGECLPLLAVLGTRLQHGGGDAAQRRTVEGPIGAGTGEHAVLRVPVRDAQGAPRRRDKPGKASSAVDGAAKLPARARQRQNDVTEPGFADVFAHHGQCIGKV